MTQWQMADAFISRLNETFNVSKTKQYTYGRMLMVEFTVDVDDPDTSHYTFKIDCLEWKMRRMDGNCEPYYVFFDDRSPKRFTSGDELATWIEISPKLVANWKKKCATQPRSWRRSQIGCLTDEQAAVAAEALPITADVEAPIEAKIPAAQPARVNPQDDFLSQTYQIWYKQNERDRQPGRISNQEFDIATATELTNDFNMSGEFIGCFYIRKTMFIPGVDDRGLNNNKLK